MICGQTEKALPFNCAGKLRGLFTTISERIYGKNSSYLVGISAVGTALVPDQVRHIFIDLRRHSICRPGVELSSSARHLAQRPPRPCHSALSLKTLAASAGFLFLLLFGIAGAEEFNIFLKTTPKIELLRPFADPATLSLLVTRADGRPVTQGVVAIVLDAPKPGTLLSTDFPLVEGSRLLEMVLPLRRGRAEWKYLFPIRGNYRLSVNFVDADGQGTSKDFPIPVLEERQKWLWLGLFCAGLFLIGFSAGRIFTTPARGGMITALLALSLAVVANVGGHDPPPTQAVSNPQSALEIDGAVVGKLTRLRWRPSDAAVVNRQLSLAITHLEKRKIMFAVDRVPVASEFGLKFHYPDGAEYRVNAVAESPGQAPVRAEQLVAVTGIEPAMMAQIPALLFFLSVILLGLGAGRFSFRYHHRAPR